MISGPFEVWSLVVLVIILAIDLLLVIRYPHEPKPKEAAIWVAFYVSLALIFAGLLWWTSGGTTATEFITGWLTEYSLSIDNLFVFLLLIAGFKVPRENQSFVIMIGIMVALVLRGAFILAGSAIIEQWAWVFYIFGAWLIYTGIRQALPQHEDEGERKPGRLELWFRKRVNMVDEYNGDHLTIVKDGRKYLTPMLLVFLALGATDFVFAIDSIPAIFGITQDPFIVFTANLFALMGLRQLYFLLGDLLKRLKYLHYGIAFILAFIGVKLVLLAFHDNTVPWINGGRSVEWLPTISTGMSLIVILIAMAVAVTASLIAARNEDKKVATQGGASEEGDDAAYRSSLEGDAEAMIEEENPGYESRDQGDSGSQPTQAR